MVNSVFEGHFQLTFRTPFFYELIKIQRTSIVLHSKRVKVVMEKIQTQVCQFSVKSCKLFYVKSVQLDHDNS